MTPPTESTGGTPAAQAGVFVDPELDEVQRAAVDALRADGIAVFDFRSLLGEELWQDAVADIEPFIRETAQTTQGAAERPLAKDDLIIRRFFHNARERTDGKKREKPRFSILAPWVKVAAAAPLVDVVNSYRGLLTRLYEVDTWFTVPYPGSPERIASQQWHRDPEDAHVVKVFVYFTDVDEGSGPFEYIRGSAEGGRYDHLWPWAEGHRYVEAEDVEGAVTTEDRRTVTGPAGTMIVADTGGIHRGGFARTAFRTMSTSTYLPPDTRKRRFKVDYTGQEGSLSPQVRFVLG